MRAVQGPVRLLLFFGFLFDKYLLITIKILHYLIKAAILGPKIVEK